MKLAVEGPLRLRMAPKKLLCELGSITRNGRGWRANANKMYAPTRASKEEADADLRAMRAAASRDEARRVVEGLRASAAAPARSVRCDCGCESDSLQLEDGDFSSSGALSDTSSLSESELDLESVATPKDGADLSTKTSTTRSVGAPPRASGSGGEEPASARGKRRRVWAGASPEADMEERGPLFTANRAEGQRL